MRFLFILILCLFALSNINAQVLFSGTIKGDSTTIDLTDCRTLVASAGKTVITKAVNIQYVVDQSQATVAAAGCSIFFRVTSAKNQGGLRPDQVVYVNRMFIEKVFPQPGNKALIVTKDAKYTILCKESYNAVQAALKACLWNSGELDASYENDTLTITSGDDETAVYIPSRLYIDSMFTSKNGIYGIVNNVDSGLYRNNYLKIDLRDNIPGSGNARDTGLVVIADPNEGWGVYITETTASDRAGELMVFGNQLSGALGSDTTVAYISHDSLGVFILATRTGKEGGRRITMDSTGIEIRAPRNEELQLVYAGNNVLRINEQTDSLVLAGQDSLLYMHTSDGDRWIDIEQVLTIGGAGTDSNFANTDLTYTGDRRHNAAGYYTRIDSVTSLELVMVPGSLAPTFALNPEGNNPMRFYDFQVPKSYYITETVTDPGAGNTVYAFNVKTENWFSTGDTFNIIVGNDILNAGSNITNNITVGNNLANAANIVNSNVLVGQNIGDLAASVQNNIFVGRDIATLGAALGEYNVGIGTTVLSDVSGDFNIAIGSLTLGTPDGSNNIGIGKGTMQLADAGDNNIAIGWQSFEQGSGSDNIVIGRQSLLNNTANGTIAIGNDILSASVHSGQKSIAIGNHALREGTTSESNIAIGESALYNATTASLNVGVGVEALYQLDGGVGNTALGYQAMPGVDNNSYNTAIGFMANITNGSQNSTAIGANAVVEVNNAIVLGEVGVVNVGIGTSAPNANAVLELTSTNRGMIPTRLTAEQASAMSLGVGDEGLFLYVLDTDATFTTKGWWGWNGAVWQKLNN